MPEEGDGVHVNGAFKHDGRQEEDQEYLTKSSFQLRYHGLLSFEHEASCDSNQSGDKGGLDKLQLRESALKII